MQSTEEIMKDEALKLALEFANDIQRGKYKGNAEEIITAIKQALAAPVQERWHWSDAPVKTQWGDEMVVADLAIDKDNTVSVYCERDQTAKVEAMFAQPAAPVQEPVAWMHWLNGPCQLFMNKDEAMMELDRLNREYPVDSNARKMRPLVFGDTTPPAAQPAPDYAWPTVADYEKDVGFEVNEAFKAAWNMARTTNDLFSQMENT